MKEMKLKERIFDGSALMNITKISVRKNNDYK